MFLFLFLFSFAVCTSDLMFWFRLATIPVFPSFDSFCSSFGLCHCRPVFLFPSLCTLLSLIPCFRHVFSPPSFFAPFTSSSPSPGPPCLVRPPDLWHSWSFLDQEEKIDLAQHERDRSSQIDPPLGLRNFTCCGKRQHKFQHIKKRACQT